MKDFISKKNYRSVSVEKWSTQFGIQKIDESQIATVKRLRSLKSVDCTKMRLTVKLKINMLPDLVFLQLYFIILVMWELFHCLFCFCLLCWLYTDKFTSVQIVFSRIFQVGSIFCWYWIWILLKNDNSRQRFRCCFWTNIEKKNSEKLFKSSILARRRFSGFSWKMFFFPWNFGINKVCKTWFRKTRAQWNTTVIKQVTTKKSSMLTII